MWKILKTHLTKKEEWTVDWNTKHLSMNNGKTYLAAYNMIKRYTDNVIQ